ncbi:MAG TPA: C69 family dipeptidase [Thermomicrobiales bacterium]|nr:C69 family dipeptidase [Thermomicrobiales bacterium]
MPADHPFSCDTSVALPPLTAGNQIIFAKNSDRAVNECQPLRHFPRQSHPAGDTLRTQYLEIPQIDTTWETIGSAPYWLWGFEIGVNEWGVTIGNEAVHTREATHEQALIGMDLVRLGLERAQTASDAVEIIGALIEQYGQGGSCEATHYRTYQNSFIIAGIDGAWILETAGHRWVAKRAGDRAAISNLLTLSDWDRSSPGIREHAEAEGWWKPDGGFAAAYQNPDTDLTTRTCRLERARKILGGYQPGIGITDMMAVLTDHGDADLPTGPQLLPTICVHANPAFDGETAASMVVSIRPDRPRLLTSTIWTAFGSPCLSLFRPVYPYLVGLPGILSTGSASYDPTSPWWVFERLQRLVARAPSSAAFVRAAFSALQADFFAETETAESHAAEQLAAGDEAGAVATLRALVDDTTERAIALVQQLTLELPSHPAYTPLPALAAYWDALDAKVAAILLDA